MYAVSKGSFNGARLSSFEILYADSCRSLGTTDITIVDFDLDGRRVYLIDTPGFDDTNNPDTETLRVIATYLGVSHAQGVGIHGIIYLHAIDDNRVGGSKQRNLDMFKALCGPGTYAHTTIATTMWSKTGTNLKDIETVANREAQLKYDPSFFQGILAQGARMFRHAHDQSPQDSARGIVRHVVNQSMSSPIPLLIQRELVDEKKPLEDTEAGKVLSMELREATVAFRQQVEQLHAEMQTLLITRDKKHEEEISAARENLRDEIQKRQEEVRTMAVTVDEMRQEEAALLEARFNQVEQQLRDELALQQAELTGMRRLLEEQRQKAAQYAQQLQRQRAEQDAQERSRETLEIQRRERDLFLREREAQEQKRREEEILQRAQDTHAQQRREWEQLGQARETLRLESERIRRQNEQLQQDYYDIDDEWEQLFHDQRTHHEAQQRQQGYRPKPTTKPKPKPKRPHAPESHRNSRHEDEERFQQQQLLHTKRQEELMELERRLREKETAFQYTVQKQQTARAKKSAYIQAVTTGIAGGTFFHTPLRYETTDSSCFTGLAGGLCIVQ